MSEETPTIGVGMLGYAFMGKAHSNAYPSMPTPMVGVSSLTASPHS